MPVTPTPQLPGYTLETLLGRGAFGPVYQAVWNGDFPCAVKLLDDGALHRGYLGMVLERLLELPPQYGLLQVYAFDLEEPQPHVSMALLPEGVVTFDELVGQVTPAEAWTLLRQLADSLAWLHGQGLVHAGLTGGNVFVVAEEDGRPKALLSDVGQAWLGDGAMERLHDQAPYVPPERWLDPGRVLQDGHAETWDVYAFGVLAWRLLLGRWPRASKLFDQVLASRQEHLTVDPAGFAEWLAEEPPPVWPAKARETAPPEIQRLLMRCLSLNPAERPASMTAVAAALHAAMLPSLDSPLAAPFATGPGKGGMEAMDLLAGPPEPGASRNRSVGPLSGSLAAPHAGPDPEKVKKAADSRLRSEPLDGRGADFSEVFTPGTEAPAADPKGSPTVEQGQPELIEGKHGGTGPGTRVGGRLAMAAAVMVSGASLYFAWQQHESHQQSLTASLAAQQELSQARREAGELTARVQEMEQARLESRREALGAAREDWTGLVASLMKSKPREAASLEAWKAMAAPMAERLQASLQAADKDPALMAGGMEPRWHLAALLAALDRPEEALPLLEHVARDLESTHAASGKTLDEVALLLTARVGARRGALLLDQRKTMEAAPLLTDASNAYETWLETHPGRQDIAREYAETSLMEGRALVDRQQIEEARTALSRVAGLLGQPGEPGFEPDDHFTLTDSLMELAALHSSAGQLDEAIEQHMQSIRLLVSYDQENRKSVPCRRRLAEGYFGLGTLLTRNGTPRDASVAFSEAVKLLTELSSESPAEPSYRLQLALTYNEVAQLIRSSRPNPAGAREALEYQNGSVTILRNLNETNTLDNTFRRHLAASLVLNGELQETAADPKAGLNRHTEALALLEDLLGEPALPETERRDCRRLSARAWTAMGGLQEKAGNKDEAIASLSKALEAWSSFAGDDPAADQIVASTRERLRKLKPGS